MRNDSVNKENIMTLGGCVMENQHVINLSRFVIGCQKGQGLDSRGHLSSGGGRILTAVGGVLWYNWRR